jgi:hypothetical protein
VKKKNSNTKSDSNAVANQSTSKNNNSSTLKPPSFNGPNGVAQMWNPFKKKEPATVAPTKTAEAPKTEKAAEPSLTEKLGKKAGLIAMCRNAGDILAHTGIWAGEKSHGMDTAIAAGGGVGSVTGLAGTATNTIKGGALDPEKKIGVQTKFADKMAGDIVSSVGSFINVVFNFLKFAKSAQKAKNKTGAVEAGRDLAATAQSTVAATHEILKFCNKVDVGVASAIPGLGILTSACNAILNWHHMQSAGAIKEEMTEYSAEYKGELEGVLSQKMDENSDLFQIEKRGKMGQRQQYHRTKPEAKKELQDITKITDKNVAAQRFEVFRIKYKIKTGITLDKFQEALNIYELGSKMQEINQKREVHSGRDLAADIVSIAGDVFAFFPIDGGITAATLKGAASGAKAAQSAAKFIQTQARNNGVLGGNKDRSADAKHGEYVEHTKTIYKMMSNAGINKETDISAIKQGQLDAAVRAERMLVATGAEPEIVYSKGEDYSPGKALTQVNFIVDAMKKGR